MSRSASRPGSRRSSSTGLDAGQVDQVAVTGMHARAARALSGKLGVGADIVVDDLGIVGRTDRVCPSGAGPGVRCSSARDRARWWRWWRWPTEPMSSSCEPPMPSPRGLPSDPVASQVAAAADLGYGTFMTWRGMVTPEPPRRPEPQRVSASAAWRSEEWKFGFVGSRDRSSGAVHLPPSRVSMKGGAVDDMDPIDRADAEATIVTYTIDRMAYSPSPPIVFAILDFDGGGRFPVELTDVDPDEVAIGDRVDHDLPKAVQRRRHPRLLLEGQAGPASGDRRDHSPNSTSDRGGT